MAYRLNASTIGERCKKTLDKFKHEIKIRHVFTSTIYLEAGKDMIIISRKNNRSPHTINIFQDTSINSFSFHFHVKVGDSVWVENFHMYIGDIEIELKNAEYYSQPRIDKIHSLDEILEKMYLRGLNMLLILYSVSLSSMPIFRLNELREFLENVVYPFSKRDVEVVRNAENYRILLGVGEGFTPSGDDFLLGFLSILNLLDEKFQLPRITLEDEFLLNYTNWVSAMFLKYAQRGYYDEDVYGLLKSISLRNEVDFTNSILQLARRGHTSGLDVSLGVLTGLASIIDNIKCKNLTEKLVNHILNIS